MSALFIIRRPAMEEIARQFKEELQELLDRYKDLLTTPQIMRIAQPIFTKTIGFKDNPERFRGVGYAKGFPIIDEIVNSGPSFLEQHALKGEFKCTD